MNKDFFGSKLNTFLLLFLIVLVFVTLNYMKKSEIYNPLNNQESVMVYGDAEDLVSFSIAPGDTVSGEVTFQGSVKNGYFFEGNILINVLDSEFNSLVNSYAMATTDWMTIEPVEFTGTLDFTGLPAGEAYIEIREDDPSDGEGGEPGSILIPIVIE